MKIVILGAGYAGLRVALDLATAKVRDQIETELVLVDRNDYHQVITWLHQVAADAIPPERARVPLPGLFPAGALAFVQAEVRAIQPDQRRVLTDAGPIAYDRLVIALGSDTVWPLIPGLAEAALPLRWWDEARALKQHIIEQFAAAARADSAEERRCRMTVVVAGGGYTGTQLAGELTHWTPVLADQYSLPLTGIRLLLVEAQERLMPGWQPKLSHRASAILRRKGVDVRVNTPVIRVEGRFVTLGRPGGGEETICAGTLVWAGGVRPPALLAEAGLRTDPDGRVPVNRFLQAQGEPDIFVIGDSAFYLNGGEPLAATASNALRQGEYVAEVLIAQCQGKPYEPYQPTRPGVLVSLGGNDGVGDALGLPLTGLPAGLLKEGVERWYLTTIGALRPQGRND
ncbi:MAG: NAD(P)/FAD-dependent oxidoreductase [Ardenticatenaceae bacterium]|nr:NAD(P)/FAD-dependent oxidoreductase [Ardenticatenaceae bacterium]HBY96218.1 NAD(P)/FAD-dependent oxidoreductase [Chloroflexota bacterium]